MFGCFPRFRSARFALRQTASLVLVALFAGVPALAPSARGQAALPTVPGMGIPAAGLLTPGSPPIKRLLVKLKPGLEPEAFARRFSMSGVAPTGEARAAVPALRLLLSHTFIGWYTYEIPSPDRLAATLETLRRRPEVLFAEPDYPIRRLAFGPPNDSYWNKVDLEHLSVVLAGLDTIDTARQDDSSVWTYTWSLQTVNALKAWTKYPGHYQTASERMGLLASSPASLPLVGVIDSGIDFTHPDFGYTTPGSVTTTDVVNGGQIAHSLARDYITDASGNRTTDPNAAKDDVGHGTSVSGVIAAAPNDKLGILGLGFPARIVPIKVIDANGDGQDSDLVDAIGYAVSAGCVVANISLDLDTTDFPQVLQDAVDYAWQHNMLIVAAAGNDGNATVPSLSLTRRYPACCDHVLAVAASSYGGPGTLYDEQIASYSNNGYQLGVTAPGGDVTSFNNTSPDGADYGLDPIQEYVLIWTLAPTYQVLLSNPDPNNPDGEYAQLGLYGLNYGDVPGTSFAAPHVTGLAALYASEHKITQQTPGAPQLLVNAIERGCDKENGRADGGFDANWGYGRIDAYMTVMGSNARRATVGGFIGRVTIQGTPLANIQVTATLKSNPSKVYYTTDSPDGMYHMTNLLPGVYTVSATIFGSTATTSATVVAGCDQLGMDILVPFP